MRKLILLLALMLPLAIIPVAEAAPKPPSNVTGSLSIADGSVLKPQGTVTFNVTDRSRLKPKGFYLVTLVCWDEPSWQGPYYGPPTGVWLQRSIGADPYTFYLGDTEALYDNWPDGAPATCGAELTYREEGQQFILELDEVSFNVPS